MFKCIYGLHHERGDKGVVSEMTQSLAANRTPNWTPNHKCVVIMWFFFFFFGHKLKIQLQKNPKYNQPS